MGEVIFLMNTFIFGFKYHIIAIFKSIRHETCLNKNLLAACFNAAIDAQMGRAQAATIHQ